MIRAGDRLAVRPPSGAGLAVGLVCFAISMTPSLIPRSWLFQALASGIGLAVGYAFGSLIGWFARSVGIGFTASDESRRRWMIALGVVAAVVAVTFTALGAHWQSRLRGLFGMDDVTPWFAVVPVGATVVAVGLVLLARKVRTALTWVVGLIVARRRSRTWQVAGGLAALAGVLLVLGGTVGGGLMAGFRAGAALADERTHDDVVRPSAAQRSGSPASLVSWESLGVQGRRFVATGPTPDDLSGFSGSAQMPIRVFAGIDNESSLNDRAALVVDELNRTDAWSRAVLVIVTTTGSGWVDPAMADAVEFMYGGDTAIAAMQYTFLPSWAVAVADQDLPVEAGNVLFDAVHDAWSKRPAASRPQLYVFGESLGSYGGQGAFGSLSALTQAVDGALWVGTPQLATMWRQLTDARDPSSAEIAPIYQDGRQVRWSAESNQVSASGGMWDRPRVLYVQHPSDAVTWWSPNLIWSEPDWLREPRGHDVLPELEWLPVVTFWQLTIDLSHAANAPAGHGHKYWLEYIDAWEAVAQPPDWTTADRERLYDIMTERALAEDVIISR